MFGEKAPKEDVKIYPTNCCENNHQLVIIIYSINVAVVTTSHHLTIVVQGYIHGRIVQSLAGSFCSRDVEITPPSLSAVRKADLQDILRVV